MKIDRSKGTDYKLQSVQITQPNRQEDAGWNATVREFVSPNPLVGTWRTLDVHPGHDCRVDVRSYDTFVTIATGEPGSKAVLYLTHEQAQAVLIGLAAELGTSVTATTTI